MSPEWMITIDKMERSGGRPGVWPLSDPLERDEWRGLEWASKLVAWFLNRRTKRPAARPRQRVADWSCAQRTAPRRF
ncbi:hypothetical protein BSY16_884 [Sinorhizobium sp. RAC02]|nr:hypothetical protein BSY16_884 [Sinorhizobium sp. RAC02]